MVPGSMLPPDTQVPAYMQQQKIPGAVGGINDIVRALMAGYTKGNASRPIGDPGPVQPSVNMAAPTPPSPVPGGMLPSAGVPFLNGTGPMGPLMQPPPSY